MLKLIMKLFAAASLLLAGGCAHHPSPAELGALRGALQLRPAATVADVGAGRGDVTLGLARLVGPRGHVFATEIEAEKRDALRERARRAGVANVTVVAATDRDTGLAHGCCEAIVMRGVYHHLTEPESTLTDLVDALKPSGRLLVVDFPPSLLLSAWPVEDAPEDRGDHGIAPEIVVREVRGAGLAHVRTVEGWPTMWPLDPYALVFQKRPARRSGEQ